MKTGLRPFFIFNSTFSREEYEPIMARHPNATPTDLIEDRGYALGRLLSQVFHPILMNVLMFLIAGYYGVTDHAAGLAWIGACILALVLPPTLFYTIRLRQGVYGNRDVSIRQQRNELYLVGFVWVLLATAVLIPLGVPIPLLAVMVIVLALGMIGGGVNLFWKISVHSASVAAVATVALLYMRNLGIALWICALAVGWARVRTSNHTPSQVLAGFLAAAMVVLVVFQILGARG
jgi:membrane-associated phospholipid phosphatase